MRRKTIKRITIIKKNKKEKRKITIIIIIKQIIKEQPTALATVETMIMIHQQKAPV